MKKKTALMCVLALTAALARADGLADLTNKLVQKGVITQDEAQQINKSQPAASPLWLKTMTFGGDFRLRVQTDSPYGAAESTRARTRVRVRFGAETQVNDKIKAALGFATGTMTANGDKNPTSSNHTFQAFNKVPMFLDYGYISYSAADGVTVSAGKVKSSMALWNVTDLIWDYGDINPDGAAVNLSKQVKDVKLFANAGYYVLNQQTDASAGFPAVYIVQPGAEYAKKDFSAKAAASYQYFSTQDKPTGSNDPGAYLGTTFAADYELLEFGLELKQKNIIGGYAGSLFGQFSRNMYDKVFAEDRNAWAFGLTFGDEKPGRLGTWNLKTMYRRLEANAAPLGLGDPNAYLGKAGKGFLTVLNLGLVKNLDFTPKWYSMTDNNGNNRITTFQFDLAYKF